MINGQKVIFNIQGPLPETKPPRKMRRLIRRLKRRKKWSSTMRWPTAKDDLVTSYMIFPENHEN